MKVTVADKAPTASDADLVCVGLFEDDPLPDPIASTPGAGDLKPAYKRTGIVHPEAPKRVLGVGLGSRGDFEPEGARVAAALAVQAARRVGARSLAWSLPDSGPAEPLAEAFVEGTVLAAYRFDRYKGSDEGEEERGEIESLELLAGASGLSEVAAAARITSEAANRARELQNLPANVATPTFLAERARELAAAHDALEVEILGREDFERLGMGGLSGVSQGSEQDPALIVLRHRRGEGSPLGLVGKAVTFDSGGISIKPSARMHEMKMDMSGGAAVLEATAAIAELGLPLELISIVPATENMPSGSAIKPGDIITQHNGKTVEVNNTDAEGRLILADTLSWCAELGAERIVDLATLTGGVVVALGSTYAGLVSNDDGWAEQVSTAGERSGELAWRLPLHPEYKELTKGTAADLTNASEKRKASTIYAAAFLEEFVHGRPWVHLDIAGTAWDVGREYVGKGASGFGVRLLLALARDVSGDA